MKLTSPYLSHKQLGVTRMERDGLIEVARFLPTIKHKPMPFVTDVEPIAPLKYFDMSHVRCRDAGCALAWMAELGYVPPEALYDVELISLNLFVLCFPPYAPPFDQITPARCAGAIYKFLCNGNAFDAYDFLLGGHDVHLGRNDGIVRKPCFL